MNDMQWEKFTEEFGEVVGQSFDTLVDRLGWLRDKYAVSNSTIDEEIHYSVARERLLETAWANYTANENEEKN